MPFMKWDESFSVNVVEIDGQHRKLIEMINGFYDAQLAGEKDALRSLLNSLADYASFHFAAEERIFARTGYPEMLAHMDEHRQFTGKVNDVMERLDSGRLVISFEITNFLKTWVAEHVKGVDKKYSAHLNAKGVY